jgi:flavocytochrome c
MNNQKVIVVGGGLSGLTTLHALLEAGANVVFLEKLDQIGSSDCNSALANSGINGCSSAMQRTHGVQDSVEDFMNDVVKSGSKKCDVSELMCMNSGRCVDWLVGRFRLNFTLSRSGGQSCARTHKTRGKATGGSVVSALTKAALDFAANNPDRLEIITQATVSRLLTKGNNEVQGVEYDKDGSIHSLRGAVVLCTGGFGADFNSHTSLIARYRPDLIKISTACNLSTSTGDGIKLGEQVGAKLTDMMYFTVNPSGLVDPKNPGSRFKVTASESLRGDGGLILEKTGRRIVNELAKRDFLSRELMKREGPFFLIINSQIAKHLSEYIEEHVSSGLMKKVDSGHELALEMNIDPSVLAQEFNEYNKQAESKQPDKFGKTHFRNCPFEMSDSLVFARIEPVIQYCAGGLMIDTSARVLGRHGQPIPGLYAAGEVAGGIHGSQPLTGNDLLDCLVFGRTAGLTAARDVYGVEYVERHTNPEIIKNELRETLKAQQEKVEAAKMLAKKLEEEIDQSKNEIMKERNELKQICEKLANMFPDLAELKFNPNGTDINAMLGLADAKSFAAEVRGKRKQADDRVKHLEEETAEFKAKMESTTNEINACKKSQKQMNAERKKLTAQLEEIRNSSAVIREIHQMEDLINTYKQRQEKAETTKRALEIEWETKCKEYEIQLANAANKKEELEVMNRLERIEQKRTIESASGMVNRMAKKIQSETSYITKAAELASNEHCPIFQLPLKRRLCPQVDGA